MKWPHFLYYLFSWSCLSNSLKSKQWKLNVYKLQSIAETSEKIIQRCQEFPPVCRFLFWPNFVRHHTFVAELPLNGKWYLLHISFDFLTQVLMFLQICRGFCRCKNQKFQVWPLFQRDILPLSFKLIWSSSVYKIQGTYVHACMQFHDFAIRASTQSHKVA